MTTNKYIGRGVSRSSGIAWYVQDGSTSLTTVRERASEYDAPHEVIARIIALSDGKGPAMKNFDFTIVKIERTSVVTETVVETPLV